MWGPQIAMKRLCLFNKRWTILWSKCPGNLKVTHFKNFIAAKNCRLKRIYFKCASDVLCLYLFYASLCTPSRLAYGTNPAMNGWDLQWCLGSQKSNVFC
jgi:hypothetical protein